jgi:hypothetical protein
VTDRERIIQFIEDTEYDRECLPHYGLIPDWFIRYNELRDLIISYLDRLEESEDINQRAFEDAHKTVVDTKS